MAFLYPNHLFTFSYPHNRSEKARESQLPSYIIFHNVHLMSIARQKPSNLQDLESVSGIGKSKVEKYGKEIIEILENA